MPAKNCFQWLMAGWHMFTAQPATWIMMTLGTVFILGLVSLTFGPVWAPVVAPVIFTLLLGGLLYAARDYHISGETRFVRLFAGFRNRLGSFSLVGVIFCSLQLLVLLLFSAIDGDWMPSSLGSNVAMVVGALAQSIAALITTLGVLFLIWAFMAITLIISPALIVKDNAPPLEAFLAAARGIIVNFRVILLLVIVLYALAGIVLITLGFGIFIYLPVLIGTLHAACEDMFPNSPKTVEPA